MSEDDMIVDRVHASAPALARALAGRAGRAALTLRLAARGARRSACLAAAHVLWGLADAIEGGAGRLRRGLADGSLRAVKALDGWACRLEAAARRGWGPWSDGGGAP